MSTIKLNTDYICLGHLTTNARSLHTNLARLAANQSVHAIVAVKKTTKKKNKNKNKKQCLRSRFGHNDILFEK